NRDRLFDRYYNKFKDRKASHIKWKNRERNSQQLILNLQAKILLLQNRQPIYQTIQTSLAHIPSYIGQEPPDDYCNRIERAISYTDTMIADANQANNNTFTDAHKADIYKSKMAGKYLPVPAQHAGNNIDTPAR